MDTEPLRRMMKKALYKRVKSGNFGRRNYIDEDA